MTLTVDEFAASVGHYQREGVDAVQRGHIRHIDNLSRRLPNDWSGMGSRSNGQDDFASLRYQLAYAAIALALAHRYRLPAAPGVFKGTFDRLIQKMILPEVWMYWRNTSTGQAVFNAHIPMESEWDPVRRDNIMYSAYVQVMTLLFAYLFDDDRYSVPGSISFRHWAFSWGGEEKRFDYDQNSLNELIYWKMVESGYVGVACEPNCVFQICNQLPLLGFRLHDFLSGGQRAAEVERGYRKAWDDFGRLDTEGRYNLLLLEDSQQMLTNDATEVWGDAWAGTVLNMLNRDLVREHYPEQIRRLLVDGPDGTLSIRPLTSTPLLGHDLFEDHGDFGWAAAWAAEVGDTSTRDRLLRFADARLAPTWVDGGLFYPRSDDSTDEDGYHRLVDPLTGNSLLALARLDVPDGLWGLYHLPREPHSATAPAVVEVDRSIDVARAFVDDEGDLQTTIGTAAAKPAASARIGRLPAEGRWSLERDGLVVARGRSERADSSDPDVAYVGGELIVTPRSPEERYVLHVD
ncbi:hypothetical protein GCM10025867_10860 [Frondihabitans sucicola]|uniref:Linalool dehydratase/isomerase domain-containing protein n=1 Tax=Frondihabitans sucicola TaxID=1268041 RepID=A0ABM8GKC3_9MICO|nr:hypothetical protein [Frondihabitans sucicola]BDZ48845.1 hypothetical protein GCM10025867_10860 [Frondihabitans sucicola]